VTGLGEPATEFKQYKIDSIIRVICERRHLPKQLGGDGRILAGVKARPADGEMEIIEG
jgi:hypothetical protein